jgi:VCBS repeat-containing protein
VDDTGNTDEDTPVTVSVLTNDSDPEGLVLSVSAVGLPAYGSASTDGTTVTYTPINRTADYIAVFNYTVSDGKGVDTATVTVLAVADNDPPTAAGDAIAVNEGAKTANLHATLLSNDTDPDTDDSHDIVAVDTSATVGAVTFDDATDTLVYTASGFDSLAAGVIATDTFAYTMEDGGGGQATATVTVAVVGVDKDIYHVYLPFTARSYVSAPDLVVERIIATSDSIQLVIKNQGHVPVANEFWIDVYIDPDPIPTAVNQVWPYLCDEGLVWGITADALPLLPGDAITLTIGDVFYVPEYSSVSWPLATDTPVYAQVDSADITTTYGAVLETHEIAGETYNNISSTLSTADVTGLALPPANGTSRSSSLSGLPPRPYIPLSPSLPR